jgi:natural product precursor
MKKINLKNLPKMMSRDEMKKVVGGQTITVCCDGRCYTFVAEPCLPGSSTPPPYEGWRCGAHC